MEETKDVVVVTNRKSDDFPVALPTIPYEIIAEIFSRLPVKTLVRFRCVSKSFKTLISDTHFIKTHLKRITSLSKTKPSIYQRIAPRLLQGFFKTCSLYSIFHNSPTDAIALDNYLLKKSFYFGQLAGSCDGLLCFTSMLNIVTLVNPSTRECNRLPSLEFEWKSSDYAAFGFGYVSETDDYKVVVVLCILNENRVYETTVKVCTLRTNCWRTIGRFEYGVPDDVSGKYVNGTLNWLLLSEYDSQLKWSIVSFDLAKETYKELRLPDAEEFSDEKLVVVDGLGVVNGCLSLICNYYYQAIRADLWVMKEYGVRESWIKLVSIPLFDDVDTLLGSPYSVPYCIAEGGEVLLEFFDLLMIYNPKNRTLRYPVETNYSYDWRGAEIYIESLVSPTAQI